MEADSTRVTHGQHPAPARPTGPAAAGATTPAPARQTGPPPPLSLPRRLLLPAGALAAVVGAFAYVGTVDPNEPGHYPPCPLLRLTGIYCPGCGGLRSAHAVVHGDLAAALQDNALAVAGYLLFAVLWTVWVVRAARGLPMRVGLGPVHLWAAGTLLLVFTVLRNLPFGGWLHP